MITGRKACNVTSLTLLYKLKSVSNQILQQRSGTGYLFIRNGEYLALRFVKFIIRLAGLAICII
ncbi:hypothetical protein ES703_58149 [subsurface metagenome]